MSVVVHCCVGVSLVVDNFHEEEVSERLGVLHPKGFTRRIILEGCCETCITGPTRRIIPQMALEG